MRSPTHTYHGSATASTTAIAISGCISQSVRRKWSGAKIEAARTDRTLQLVDGRLT